MHKKEKKVVGLLFHLKVEYDMIYSHNIAIQKKKLSTQVAEYSRND